MNLNPRLNRAIMALVGGPKFREELDRIAGCSNSPELVADLRRRGLGSHLECVRVSKIDRDGRKCMPGLYSLTPMGRALALKWVSSMT